MKKDGRRMVFSHPVHLLGYAAAGGKRERQGPLGGRLCATSEDDTFGQPSFEKAEVRMQSLAGDEALRRAGLGTQPDAVLAGDLLNQCTASAMAARRLQVPFLGLYGACSTMAESLMLGAALCDGGFLDSCLCVTSSHFCSAERQYRFPLEYASLRPPTAQWTVTGAGAVVLGRGKGSVVRSAMPGRIVDYGVRDANNMGAAMAPAAADTLAAFFRQSGSRPEQYDAIFTGDLGRLGRDLAAELLREEGFDAGDRLRDCGTLIYAAEDRCVGMGGSGCGCSATVLCTHILPSLEQGSLRRVLFAATGALMSPTTSGQGESIPAVAHVVELCSQKEEP